MNTSSEASTNENQPSDPEILIRRQVPESDPAYVRHQDVEIYRKESIGADATSLYDGLGEDVRRVQDKLLQYESAMHTAQEALDTKQEQTVTQEIRDAQKKISSERETQSRMLRQRYRLMFSDVLNLADSPSFEENWDGRKEYARAELRNILDHDNCQDIRDVLGIAELEQVTLPELSRLLVRAVDENILSDDMLYRMAKHQEQAFVEHEVKLAEYVEVAKEEIRRDVSAAVARGELPSEAETALPRIDRVRVFLRDQMRQVTNKTIGVHDGKEISVSSEILAGDNQEELKHILYHEWMHALAGISITVESEPIDGYPDEYIHRVKRKKAGVSIRRGDQTAKRWNYRWLDEAITEWLAVKLLGHDVMTAKGDEIPVNVGYYSEIHGLKLLFDAGLSQDTVTKAYFENFSTDIPPPERGKHFSQLVKDVNAVDGWGEHTFTYFENHFLLANEITDSVRRTGCDKISRDIRKQIEETRREYPRMYVYVTVGKQADTQVEGIYYYEFLRTDDVSSLEFKHKHRILLEQLLQVQEEYTGELESIVVSNVYPPDKASDD